MEERALENLFDKFLEKKIKGFFVDKLNNIRIGRILKFDASLKTVDVFVESTGTYLKNLVVPRGVESVNINDKGVLISSDPKILTNVLLTSIVPTAYSQEISTHGTTLINPLISGGTISRVVLASSNIVGSSITGGSWLTWTPIWTGLSVYNGTITAKYLKIGTNVNYSMRIIFGSSTSVTGSVTFSKPLSSVSTNVFDPYCSNLIMRDVSAPQNFFGLPRNSSDSVFNIGSYITSGSNIVIANIGASYPFQWGVSDVISAQGFYESVN